MLGRRPVGAIIKRGNPPSNWKDVDIMAYIENRTGAYDDVEDIILSDPWVDGAYLYEQGEAYEDIYIQRKGLPTAMYQERLKLMRQGWTDALEMETQDCWTQKKLQR